MTVWSVVNIRSTWPLTSSVELLIRSCTNILFTLLTAVVVAVTSRGMSRNTRLCFVCYTSERVNISGNAPSNITRSSDCARRPRRSPVDRTSSEWVHDSDTGRCLAVDGSSWWQYSLLSIAEVRGQLCSICNVAYRFCWTLCVYYELYWLVHLLM